MSKYNIYVENVSVEAVFNKLGGVDGAVRFLQDKTKLVEVEGVIKKYLGFLSVVSIPAMKKFVVKKRFVEGEGGINCTSERFEKWFFNTIEEPTKETEFRQSLLKQRTDDSSIVSELGGEANAKVHLSQIEYLMNNVYKKDGTVYISYAETTVFEKYEESYKNEKDENVVVRAINVHFDKEKEGWNIDASSFCSVDKWNDGVIVSFDNSCWTLS